MFIKYVVSIGVVVFLSIELLFVSCGRGINGGPVVHLNMINTGAVVSGGGSSLISLTNPALHSFNLGDDTFFSLPKVNPSVGAASASQIKSLKYYFSSVQICKSMSINGTAWNNPTGCAYLYNQPYSTSEYDAYQSAQAKADTDSNHYLDVMDMPHVKAKLNKSTTIDAGEYNYGIISWYRPIKIKAEVQLKNGTWVVSKSDISQITDSIDSSGHYSYHMEGASLTGTEGSSEEATVMMNNGGSFFKFQNPWVYDGDEEVQLDLVFNPDSIVKGSSATSNYALREPLNGNNAGHGLSVPLLQMTPVVHKSSDTTMKEVYLVSNSSLEANIRMELYYVKQDSNKTIYGVDLRSVYKSTTDENVMDPGMVIKINTNSDGTITLLDWQNQNMLANFTRKSIEGETGTVTVSCSSSGIQQSSICGSGNTTDVSAGYTLLNISTVQ